MGYTCAYLDGGDGEVIRGGVIPLDGVDHAGVVHLAEKLYLELLRSLLCRHYDGRMILYQHQNQTLFDFPIRILVIDDS